MLYRTSSAGCVLMVAIMCVCSAHAQIQQQPAKSLWSASANASADDRNYDLRPGADPDNHLVSPFVRHLAEDQKHFWTFPTRLRVQDLKWILPAAGITAGFIASDSWISKQVPDTPSQLHTSQNIS
ncbi:MAG TPA: hypothetical protein VLW06_15690, partial [Terriglobales bacterium]|nr:hypothetical protein [Terriglobales bacterium]